MRHRKTVVFFGVSAYIAVGCGGVTPLPPPGDLFENGQVTNVDAAFACEDPHSQHLYCTSGTNDKLCSVDLSDDRSTTVTLSSPVSYVSEPIANSNTASRGSSGGSSRGAEGTVFISSNAAHSVLQVDEKTGNEIGSIAVPNQLLGPAALAFDPGSGRLYVGVDQGIDVFDTKNGNGLVGTIATVGNAFSMAINPGANRLYADFYGSKQLAVLDTSKLTQLNLITLPDVAGDITVNSVTGLVYASQYDNANVLVLSADLSVTLATVPVGSNPWGVGVDSIRNRIYVANYNYSSAGPQNGSITEIDGSKNKVVTTLTLGKGPTGIQVDENADKVYVAEAVDNTIVILNGN